MPVHKSAKKSMRQEKKANQRNRTYKSRIRTARNKLERAIAENAENRGELYKSYVSLVDRAASKGVIHPNNASRKKMRMAHRVNTGQEQQ